MGWFGRLLGTDKAIDNLLDKDDGLLVRAGGWVDGLSYTDQEEASDNLKTRQWGLAQLQALAPFKVVQRVIALSVMSFWVFVGINIVVAIWVKAIWPEVKAMDALLSFAFSDYVFWPVVSVLGLYMSGGVIPHMFGKKYSK